MVAQIANRTIFTRDNVEVLRGMDSDSVDLIYLDPPFNSNKHYSAPVGSKAAGAEFKDAWTLDDMDVAWVKQLEVHTPRLAAVIKAAGMIGGKGDQSYLTYMAVRLLEMHRVLKETGSIYLHCDPTMSHSLKLLLDAIFGKNNFRNEIIWSYQRWTGATKHFQRMHDTILFYAASARSGFNILKESYSSKSKHKGRRFSMVSEGRIHQTYTTDTSREKAMRDVWELSYLNSQARERTGYPTQKPLKLLERIIQASSNKGDMVLDPFCGCATACIASERLEREWIGIDISSKAYDLVKDRLYKEAAIGDEYNPTLLDKIVHHRTDIPVWSVDAKRSKDIKKKLYGMQSGNCNGCKRHFEIHDFHVDHIVPQSKGGQDVDSNLQLLCGHCNSVKGTKDMAHLVSQLESKGMLPKTAS